VADGADRLAAPGREVRYELTDGGRQRMKNLGIQIPARGRRPLVLYCVDWSEQRHHLGGALGAVLAARLFELGWVQRARSPRALKVTQAGHDGLNRELGVAL
jgi:hypothetical protein